MNVFRKYLTDSLGNLSSTRLQSIQTHFYTLLLITILVITYIVLTIIHSVKVGTVELVEVPDNVTNIIIFIITVLLTYASAPKAFAQRAELNAYRTIKQDENTKDNLTENN